MITGSGIPLACPECQSAYLQEETTEIICTKCKRVYPIKDGIPLFFTDNIRHFIQDSRHLNVQDVESMRVDSTNLPRHVTWANIDFHDRSAEKYDEDPSSPGLDPYSQIRVKSAMEYLAQNAGNDMLLDLGCGTGNAFSLGKEVFARTVGVDVSLEMLRIARRKGGEVFLGDAYKLPFPSETFNVAILFSVLHHLPDPENVVAEALRTLKPNGILYIDFEPNFGAYSLMAQSFLHQIPILKTFLSRKNRHAGEDIPSYALAEYFHELEPGMQPERLKAKIRERVPCHCRIFWVDKNTLFQRYKIGTKMLGFYFANLTPLHFSDPSKARYFAMLIRKIKHS